MQYIPRHSSSNSRAALPILFFSSCPPIRWTGWETDLIMRVPRLRPSLGFFFVPGLPLVFVIFHCLSDWNRLLSHTTYTLFFSLSLLLFLTLVLLLVLLTLLCLTDLLSLSRLPFVCSYVRDSLFHFSFFCVLLSWFLQVPFFLSLSSFCVIWCWQEDRKRWLKEMTEDGGWRMKEEERGRRTRKENRREASVETFGNEMMKLSLLHKDIDSKSKA